MHEGKVVIENSENYSGYEAWRTNDKVWERFHHIQMSYLGQKATYIECEWEILKHEEAQVDQQYDLQKKIHNVMYRLRDNGERDNLKLGRKEMCSPV